MTTPSIHPRLVVRDVDRAIRFYAEAFDAVLNERYADPSGFVVHAQVTILGSPVAITEEKREWHNHAPPSLGGSPVILSLTVPDADAVGERLLAHGAKVVFPIANQDYGTREGRFADPFGHLWIVSQVTETLTADEIQERVDAWKAD